MQDECRTQKLRKNRHLGYGSTIGKIVKQQYLLHMSSEYGELRPTNGWDRLASLGHPTKLQRVSRLAFLTAATSPKEGQPNFARCLALSCSGTLYTFLGAVAPNGILPGVKFTLGPSLCGVVQGMELRNFRSSLFSTEGAIYNPRAAITFGMDPHSSCCLLVSTVAACRQTWYCLCRVFVGSLNIVL